MSIMAVATNCSDDVLAKIMSIPEVANKSFIVTSEEDLLLKTKGLVFPCVGVVYEGLTPTSPRTTSPKIISGVLTVSIVVMYKSMSIAGMDSTIKITALLDNLRESFRGARRSPTGEFWEWKGEGPVKANKGSLMYVQRWSTIANNL